MKRSLRRWMPVGVSVAVVVGALAGGCERGACGDAGKSAAAGASACGDQDATTAAREAGDEAMAGPRVGGAKDAARVEVVNLYCPLLVGQRVGNEKRCEARLTREFRGQRVGFCDAMCLEGWDQMTEERKAEVLAEAMGLEAGKP